MSNARQHLVLELHQHLVALDTAVIERMVLADDLPPGAEAEGLLHVGDAWACFDLGAMFGLGPTRAVWVLMHVPHALGSIRVALGTGPCLFVRALRPIAALPASCFRARPGALTGAFDAVAAGVRHESPVGLVLDPRRLFDDAEVARARTQLLADLERRARAS